ncbi:MAG: CotH kinase family protein [Clostridia bacterium]
MHKSQRGRTARMLQSFLALCALLLALPFACATAVETPTIAYLPVQGIPIYAQAVEDELYLFLPSSAPLGALALALPVNEMLVSPAAGGSPALSIHSGEPFDLIALLPTAPEDGKYRISLRSPDADAPIALTIMHSAGIASLHILSTDPIAQGRAWLDGNEARVVETTGSMLLMREDGSVVYQDALQQIRGRGNTTWDWSDKKPYQLKLEHKANLLDVPNAKARTWALLADSFDATHLHNAITLDLGQELGMRETPQYRFVDLYYDGEYRGLYLLCEKAQVNPGRLEIADYGSYIEELYPSVDDPALFPPVQATDDGNAPYQYTKNIEVALGGQGAYLLELDVYNYQRSASWFVTAAQNSYAIESPKYASKADVEWLNCFMQEMEATASNYGVHPTNGNTIDHYIDLPSMARYLLINQFAKTADFGFTSTYFHIPAGEKKLYGGPLWDFDISYAIRNTRTHEGGADGYVLDFSWIHDLMAVPAFQEAYIRCFEDELLPVLNSILLGDESASGYALRSLDGYLKLIEPSRRMNDVLWTFGGGYDLIDKDALYLTFEENIAYFRTYLINRTAWLTADIAQWAGFKIEHVGVTVSYQNANITECAKAYVTNPYSNCTLQGLTWTAEKVPEEPWHTLYTARFTLVPNPGSSFSQDAAINVNGYEIAVENNSPDALSSSFRFVGPTFTPAVYDGIDYALVFNADYFAQLNPEAAEECGDDAEALLQYYVDYVLPEGSSAIETFDFDWLISNYEALMDSYYMCDPYSSTLHYLEHAYADELLAMEAPVLPTPSTV